MPSFTYTCMEKIIRAVGIKKYYELNREQILAFYEKKLKGAEYAPPKPVSKTMKVETLSFQNQVCYKVSPKEATKNAVLFVHGGGYIMEINNLHWTAVKKIANEKKTDVFVPIYPLAPKSTWRPAFSMLKEVYKMLLTSYAPETVTIIGDSAGAQLVLSFCQQCREEKLPQPGKMILLSPPINFSPDPETMKRYKELEPKDPMLSIGILSFLREFWAGKTDLKDYHISPFYGDFHGLAPMEVFCGTKEILYATIPALKEKAEAAGVPFTLHIGEEMIHIWPYFLWSKESRTAFKQILSGIPDSRP